MQCEPVEAVEGVAEIPPLFASYLSLGARVCSFPAVDRAFKVVDFFVVLDLEDVPPRVRQRFLGGARWDVAQAS